MMHRCLLLVAFLLAVGVAPAHAQEAPRVGLTIGYPASVGVLWHVSDRVAVRPDFAFSWTSSEPSSSSSSIGLTRSDSSVHTTVGIGGLIYVAKWEALRAYVAPHFGYSRDTSTFTSTSPAILFTSFPSIGETTTTFASTTTGKISTYETSGSFGAEYALGRRFSVFAEVGLAFTRHSSVSLSSGDNRVPLVNPFGSSTKGVTTRSGIGAILYFF